MNGIIDSLALADWYEERGEQHNAQACRDGPPVWSNVLPVKYLGVGRGVGRGFGDGVGRGVGRGVGGGVGRGVGGGDGRGFGLLGGDMEIGDCYMIQTVDWFCWVGRVVRQVGPFEYEFESASKIADTNNGDCWEKMAEGDAKAREAASYKHYKVPVLLGIGAVVKIKWEGKTPQEEGRPG